MTSDLASTDVLTGDRPPLSISNLPNHSRTHWDTGVVEGVWKFG